MPAPESAALSATPTEPAYEPEVQALPLHVAVTTGAVRSERAVWTLLVGLVKVPAIARIA